ncbi:hypothetical protein J6590_071334 [Homalodisca vitripennis]|nr:hypothetical protein J6590_071334 [Homalodisca vitripennis]
MVEVTYQTQDAVTGRRYCDDRCGLHSSGAESSITTSLPLGPAVQYYQWYCILQYSTISGIASSIVKPAGSLNCTTTNTLRDRQTGGQLQCQMSELKPGMISIALADERRRRWQVSQTDVGYWSVGCEVSVMDMCYAFGLDVCYKGDIVLPRVSHYSRITLPKPSLWGSDNDVFAIVPSQGSYMSQCWHLYEVLASDRYNLFVISIRFHSSWGCALCRLLAKSSRAFNLYILETTLFCVSKCPMTNGRNIHVYETRGRDNYRIGRHRTVVYERLPSQAVVHFSPNLTSCINSIREAIPTSTSAGSVDIIRPGMITGRPANEQAILSVRATYSWDGASMRRTKDAYSLIIVLCVSLAERRWP